MKTEIDPQIWKNEFKKKTGHNPKILLIGNVVNNAYQIAKLLNKSKIECDVLCNDYYHIMGCPEWDDAEITEEIKHQMFPNFDLVNLHGFKRQKWFAQGPLLDAVDYLMTRRKNKILGFFQWRKLEKVRKYVIEHNGELSPESQIRNCKVAENDYRQYWEEKLKIEWTECFPDRDAIKWSPICDMFLNTGYTLQPLLAQYDIVVAFGESVLIPYFAECKKYVSFEHGTIRKYKESKNELCNLAMLAYAKSNVLINTNTDCYNVADYITKNSNSIHFCGLHGIGMNELRKRFEKKEKMRLRERLGIKKDEPIIFSPARYKYDVENKRYVKGSEKVYYALKKLAEEGTPFIAVLVNWGVDLARFKEKIEKDSILKKHIRWIDPLPKFEFMDAISSSDVVLDQFTWEVFGAISIETMTAKKAVLISHSIDKKIMGEFFSSTWPILEANSGEELKDKIKSVIMNKNLANEITEKQFQWVFNEHGAEKIASRFCGALKMAIEGE